MNDVLKEAVKRYGTAAQLDMVIEEMSELTKEICKLKRNKRNRNNIIEEIADVEIMLEQLKYILQIEDYELSNLRDIKINRLADRLITNCSLITKMVNEGEGTPVAYETRCMGYAGNTDEPCETCKECRLNTCYEE